MIYYTRIQRLLIKVFVLIFFATVCLNNIPMFEKRAEAESENTSWINVSSKYLELGTEGNDVFDFNIRKEALNQIDGTYWYIRSGKGTPDCITIDHKTGVVKAKSAGTAYIRCRLTHQDNIVARPEAKVTVYNKITEVDINNLPADLTIPAGQMMDFNRSIMNTAIGKKARSNGITRWEIVEDTAGAGTISDNGQVLPMKAGTFNLRAVCFTSQTGYFHWLSNKDKNSWRITAASDWVTIKVSDSNGKGYATTQEELVKLLEAPGITEIVCDVGKFTDITIPAGDFREKSIILDAPSKVASNRSATNEIQNFATYATYNMTDHMARVHVSASEGSYLGTLSSREQGIALFLRLFSEGGLQKLELLKQTDLTITSAQQLYKLLLTLMGYEAEGSVIRTEVPIDAEFQSGATVNFLPGSQGSVSAAKQALIDSLLLHNQSKGQIILDVGGSRIPIGSGSPPPTPSFITEFLNNFTNQGPSAAPNRESITATSAVTGSAIVVGQTLSQSILSGTFVNSNNQTVPGRFIWNQPSTIAQPNQSYPWAFLPNDSTRYNLVTGNIVVNIREASQVLADAAALVNNNTFAPLSEENKSSVLKVKAAMKSAIQDLVIALNPGIVVEVSYQDGDYQANLSLVGLIGTITVNDIFFDNQDTSLAILPDGAQYVTSISGSAVTVVSGTSVGQLQSALTVNCEYAILIPPDIYPDSSETVTQDMRIDVIAEDNITRRLYTIIISIND